MVRKRIDDQQLEEVLGRAERALQDGPRITGSYSASYVCAISDGTLKLSEEVHVYRKWEEILRTILEMKKGVLKTQEQMYVHTVEHGVSDNLSERLSVIESLMNHLRLEIATMEVMLDELDAL